jgi:asparagine synthase (glutamine-hydrolysing)
LQRLLARAHTSREAEAIGLRIEGFPGDVRHPRGLCDAELDWLDRRKAEFATTLYRPQRDLLSEMLVLDMEWQLAESLLQKADKMSMGASIELRTPFLDLEVGKVAARIPSSLKLPAGGPGKLVLRKCLGRKLNEDMTRPKKGFPVPLAEWFAGPLRPRIEDEVLAPGSACRANLEAGLLKDAWKDFLAGKWDGARTLYALLLYEVWHREVVKSS